MITFSTHNYTNFIKEQQYNIITMEKVDLNKLSFDDLQKEVKKLEENKIKVVSKEKHWEIGTNYLIRTVTHIQLGKLIISHGEYKVGLNWSETH